MIHLLRTYYSTQKITNGSNRNSGRVRKLEQRYRASLKFRLRICKWEKSVPAIGDTGSERVKRRGRCISSKHKLEQKGASTPAHRVTSRPQILPFLFARFAYALYWTFARLWETKSRSTHVLSTRSRVEIDKCRACTSVTYLTGAPDSFGVKKSLRFPTRY